MPKKTEAYKKWESLSPEEKDYIAQIKEAKKMTEELMVFQKKYEQ